MERLRKRESGGVSRQSRALWCVLPQDAHRCCRGQDKGGNTHWPPFQEWHISCDTRGSLAERVAESWRSGCCTTCRAHWAWVWSNPWQTVQDWPVPAGCCPRTVAAKREVFVAFHTIPASNVACCRNSRS